MGDSVGGVGFLGEVLTGDLDDAANITTRINGKGVSKKKFVVRGKKVDGGSPQSCCFGWLGRGKEKDGCGDYSKGKANQKDSLVGHQIGESSEVRERELGLTEGGGSGKVRRIRI